MADSSGGGLSAGKAYVEIVPRLAPGFQKQLAGVGQQLGQGVGDGVQKGLGKTGEKFASVGKSLATKVSLPIAAGFAVSVASANTLNNKLAEVVTLTGATGAQADKTFKSFQTGVRGLSTELGIAQQTLTSGLYQALSAGVPQANVFTFMQVAGKAAIAGVTDVETSVDGLTSVINAFGLKATDVQAVADSMFAAVKGGKTTFRELSDALFNVAPIAAAVGIKFSDVNAAIATLTSSGVPTSVATTQIRAGIQGLVRSSPELTKIFKAAGYESAQAAIKQGGLAKAFGLVYKAAGGNLGTLQKLVGSIEGVSAIQSLAGTNAAGFTKQLDNQAHAAGAVNDAFKVIDKQRGIERLKVSFQNLGLAIGNALLPFVNSAVKALGPMVDAFTALPGPIQNVVVVVGLLAAALGPLLILVGKFATALKALQAINAGAAFLSIAPPVLIVLAVLAALVAIGYLIYRNWDTIKAAAVATWDFIRDKVVGAVSAIVDFVKDKWPFVIGILTGGLGLAVYAIVRNWDTIKKAFGKAIDAVLKFVKDHWKDALLIVLLGPFAPLAKLIADHWNTIKDVFGKAIGFIRDVVVGGFDAIAGRIEDSAKTIAAILIAPFNFAFNALTTLVDTWVGRFEAAFTNVANFIGPALDLITTPITVALDLITTAVTVALAFIVNVWRTELAIVTTIVTTAFNVIVGIITTALGIITNIISTAWGVIVGVVSTAVGFITNVIATAFNVIVGIIQGAWNIATAIFQVALGIITGIVNGLAGIITGAVNRAKGPIESLGRTFSSVKDTIGGVASSIGDAVSGMANSIADAFQRAVDIVVGAAQRIGDAIRSIPGGSIVSGALDLVGFASGTPWGHTTPVGQPFLVGEKGPELAWSRVPLKIAPTHQTLPLLEALGTQAQADTAPAGGVVVRGPLIAVNNLEVRSDQDVVNIGRQLTRDTNRRARALGVPVALSGGQP